MSKGSARPAVAWQQWPLQAKTGLMCAVSEDALSLGNTGRRRGERLLKGLFILLQVINMQT